MIEWSNETFVLYLVTLIITCLISYIVTERHCNEDYWIQYKVKSKWVCLSLVPMLILLSIRSIDMGIDLTRYYVSYKAISNSSISSLLNAANIREPLFSLTQVLISTASKALKLNDDLIFYLFCMALLWIVFAFWAILREVPHNGLVLAISVLYIQMFFTSFSMLRQIIAISLMLLAFSFLSDGKKLYYWVLLLIATGVHYTACIGVAAYFYVRFDQTNGIRKYLYKAIVIASMLIFFLFGSSILNRVFGTLDTRYTFLGQNSSGFGVGQTLFRLPFLAVVLGFRKDLIECSKKNVVFIDLTILDFFVGQLNYVDANFNRLSLYFAALRIFLVPSIYQVVCRKFGKSFANLVFIIVILIWLVVRLRYYVFTNPYQIMPYSTSVY